MALLIPNLNLPKGCGDCLFTTQDISGYSWCCLDPSLWIDMYGCTRHEKCSLKEVTIGIDLAKGNDFTSYVDIDKNGGIVK